MTFDCGGTALVGVLHRPHQTASVGVVIVVGGPQYRVGSHRQFVLLARALTERGIAVLRFDCRGMGDSDGQFSGFEHIAPDVRSAIEFFFAELPTLTEVALWGLCDASSAICECAESDRRITAVALLNPWVHTEEGKARARLRHYYLQRLIHMDFVRKICRGDLRPLESAKDFLRDLGRGLWRRRGPDLSGGGGADNRLAEAMAASLVGFKGRILLILSGQDLTGREFEDAAQASRAWRRLLAQPRVTMHRLEEADHTFSRRAWRDRVAEWTLDWLRA